jgi:cysteine desulfurase
MDAYLDHAAATPLDPRVREAMLPFLGEEFGSPASLHARGRRPAAALARCDESEARAEAEECSNEQSGTQLNRWGRPNRLGDRLACPMARTGHMDL